LAFVTVSNTTVNPVANAKALITFVIGADGATNAQVGSAFFQASSSRASATTLTPAIGRLWQMRLQPPATGCRGGRGWPPASRLSLVR
jgi:hypothetical protein